MNKKNIIGFLGIALTTLIAEAQNQETMTTDSISRQLQEIVVTARQPATRLVGSTLVSTIPGSSLADLGTALDVLGQLPMITVDNGSVSVIGKSNIEIYIDGRPMRDGSELQQLLSSDMKRVELLMAPGAAYQSSTDAVLRITTRRNFVRGLSLTEQMQVRKRRRWSANDFIDLSYRSGGWDLFVDGSFNRDNSVIKGSTVNSLIYNGRRTEVGSNQYNRYPSTAWTVRPGFNYSDGPQSMGAYYRYNPERGDFSNHGSEWIDGSAPLSRIITKGIRAHSHLVSTYYENTFAGKYLIHFDGDFKHSVGSNRNLTTYPSDESDDVSSTDRRLSTLWAGKLYLSFPLGNGDLTAGTQDSYTHTGLDYRMLNPEIGSYIPSAVTDARQTSAALFASWSATVGRFSLTAGARYEYTDYRFTVDGRRDNDASRRDNLLTPDISLGYSFGNDTQLSLAYKMSTVKPPYSQLTGALTYTGRHEIEGGNPGLRDERMHDVQLFGTWRGFMLQADYLRSIDTYAFVKQLYPAADLQLLMHPINIDVASLNVYLVWNKTVGCWMTDVTLGMYRQWLEIEGVAHDRPILSYYFDNTISLPSNWTLTANVSGRSDGDMHTNRFAASPFTMNLSVGKTLLGKSLSLRLSATDIFNTSRNGWSMDTYGVTVDKRQRYDNRGITLDLTYRFNPRRNKYKGSAASQSELNRL